MAVMKAPSVRIWERKREKVKNFCLVELESEVPNLHPCQMQTPIDFCASCFTLGE